jgi:predicted hotdog family 3-hydroxylacyl-ACP dehydratase
MSFAGIDIETVVPHRGRMLMVDQLLANDPDSVVVSAVIGRDNLFADAQGVPAWVGIEYMAQAIAAWAGCRALTRKEPAKIGFLLGTRRYDCQCQHFAFGAQLRIEATRELFGENGLGMFSCRILEGELELAKAHVSVYEPPDSAAFLETQYA